MLECGKNWHLGSTHWRPSTKTICTRISCFLYYKHRRIDLVYNRDFWEYLLFTKIRLVFTVRDKILMPPVIMHYVRIFLLLLFVSLCAAKRILLVPCMLASHILEQTAVSEGLGRRDHEEYSIMSSGFVKGGLLYPGVIIISRCIIVQTLTLLPSLTRLM